MSENYIKKWSRILLNWMNCLEIFKEEIKDFSELKDGFYLYSIMKHQSLNGEAEWCGDHAAAQGAVDSFLKSQFPHYQAPETEDLAVIMSTSLLLHSICIDINQNKLKVVMCRNLCNKDQAAISIFSTSLMKHRPITYDEVQNAIFCATDVNENEGGVPGGSTVLTPPGVRALQQRELDLRRLRTALDAERFDKCFLQDELKRSQSLADKLGKENNLLKKELSRSQLLSSVDWDNENIENTNPIGNSELKAAEKQIVLLKKEKDQMYDKLQDQKEQFDSATQKLTAALNAVTEEHRALEEAEARAFAAECEAQTERTNAASLRELLIELRAASRNHNNNLSIEVDELDTTRQVPSQSGCNFSFQSTCSTEDLASAVIEVQLKELQSKNNKLEEQLIEKQHELEAFKNQVDSQNKIILDLDEKIRSLIEDIHSLKQTKRDLELKVEQQDITITLEQNEIRALNARINVSEEENTNLTNELTKFKNMSESLEEEKYDIGNKLQLQINKLDEITFLKNKADQEIMDKNMQYAKLQDDLVSLKTVFETQIIGLTKELNENVQSKNDLCIEINKLSSELLNVTNLKSKAECEIADKDMQCTKLKDELMSLQTVSKNQIKKLSTELEENQGIIANISADLEKITSLKNKAEQEIIGKNMQWKKLKNELLLLKSASTNHIALLTEELNESDTIKSVLEMEKKKLADTLAETTSLKILAERELIDREKQCTLLQNEVHSLTTSSKSQIAQLIKELEQLRCNRKRLELEIKNLSCDLVELKSSKISAEQMITTKDRQYAKLQDELESLNTTSKNQIAQLNVHLNEHQCIKNSLEIEIKKLTDNLAEITSSNILALQKIAVKDSLCTKLQNELESLIISSKGQIAQLSEELQEHRSIKNELELEIKNLLYNVEEINSSKTLVEQKVVDGEIYCAKLLDELELLSTASKNKMAELNVNLNELLTIKNGLEIEIKKLSDNLAETTRSKELAEQKMSDKDSLSIKLQNELDLLIISSQSRITQLLEELEEHHCIQNDLEIEIRKLSDNLAGITLLKELAEQEVADKDSLCTKLQKELDSLISSSKSEISHLSEDLEEHRCVKNKLELEIKNLAYNLTEITSSKILVEQAVVDGERHRSKLQDELNSLSTSSKSEIAQVNATLNELQFIKNGLEVEIKKLSDNLAETTLSKELAEQEMADKDSLCTKLQNELDSLIISSKSEITHLSEELEEHRCIENDLEIKVKKLSDNLAEITLSKRSAEQEVADKDSRCTKLQKELDSFITASKSQITHLSEELEEHRCVKSVLELESKNLLYNLAEITSSKTLLEQAVVDGERQSTKLQDELNSLSTSSRSEIAQLNVNLNELQSIKNGLEIEIKKLSDNLAETILSKELAEQELADKDNLCRKLQNELDSLITSSKSEITHLSEELEEHRCIENDLEIELKTLSSNLAQISSSEALAIQAIADKDNLCTNLQNQLQSLTSSSKGQIAQMSKDLHEYRYSKNKLELDLKNVSDNIAEIITSKMLAEQELIERDRQYVKLQDELESIKITFKSQIAQLNDELEERCHIKHKLELELKQLTDKLAEITSWKTLAEVEVADKDSLCTKLQNELESLKTSSNSHIVQLTKELSEKNNMNKELNTKLNKLIIHIEEITTSKNLAEEEISNNKLQCAQLQKERDALETLSENLKSFESTSTYEIMKLTKQLEETRNEFELKIRKISDELVDVTSLKNLAEQEITNKVMEYANLQNEIESIKTASQSQITKLTKELENVVQKYDNLLSQSEQQLAQKARIISNLENEILSLKDKIHNNLEELAKLLGESSGIKNEFEVEIKKFSDDLVEMSSLKNNAELEITKKDTQLTESQNELTSLKFTFEGQIVILTKELETCQGIEKKLVAEIKKLSGDLTEVTLLKNKADLEIANKDAQLAELQNELMSIQMKSEKELKDIHTTKHELEAQVKKLYGELADTTLLKNLAEQEAAERSEQCANFKVEIKKLSDNLVALQDNTEYEIADRDVQSVKLQNDFACLKTASENQIMKLTTELENITQKYNNLLSQSEQQMTQSNLMVSNLEGEIISLKDKIHNLEELSKSLTIHNKLISSECDLYRDKVSEKEGIVTYLESKANTLTAANAELEKNLDMLLKQKEGSDKSLELSNKRCDNIIKMCKDDVSNLRCTLSEKDEELENLKEKVQNLTKEVESATNERDQFKLNRDDTIDNAEIKVAKLSDQVIVLKSELNNVRQEKTATINNLEVIIYEKDKQIQEIKKIYQNDKLRINELEVLVKRLTEQIEANSARYEALIKHKDSTIKRYQSRSMPDVDERIKEVREEYEDKLNRMKVKMKELFKHEKAKYQDELTRQSERAERLENRLANITAELWQTGEKFLTAKHEYDWLRRKSKQDTKFTVPRVRPERASSAADLHTFGLRENKDLDSVSLHSAPPHRSDGNGMHMSDEEGEVFDNAHLAELHMTPVRKTRPAHGAPNQDWKRLSELQRRNSLCPPHLRSSYPAETQFHKLDKFKDDELKFLPNNETTKPPSEKSNSKAPIPAVAPNERRKDPGAGPVYRRPGPPTPSKHGGRLSATANELRTSVNEADISVQPVGRKSATPSRLRALFRGTSSTQESGSSTPKSRRFSIFKKTS